MADSHFGRARLAPETVSAAARALQASRRVWITTHIKSDGDGIGCELALARALRARGAEARIINDTVVPRPLRFLLAGPDEILIYDPERDDPFINEADMAVVLDVGLGYRLGRLEALLRQSRATKLCLDHHLDTEPLFDHLLCDPELNATGEILFHLLKVMGAELTPCVATPLYTSLVVDSGNFSYERCRPETFRIAGALVEAGARPYYVHVNLHWRRSLAEVKLEGEVIDNVELCSGGRVACGVVSKEMLRRYAIDPMEMPDIVNIPLSLDGVEIALLFVEMDSGYIKVSARGKGRVKVSKLAHMFGGGGHPLAAGFSIKATLDEARRKVLDECSGLINAADFEASTISA